MGTRDRSDQHALERDLVVDDLRMSGNNAKLDLGLPRGVAQQQRWWRRRRGLASLSGADRRSRGGGAPQATAPAATPAGGGARDHRPVRPTVGRWWSTPGDCVGRADTMHSASRSPKQRRRGEGSAGEQAGRAHPSNADPVQQEGRAPPEQQSDQPPGAPDDHPERR